MTSRDEHVFPYYRSPQDIRNESFTHRIRGLDENEVHEYLDLLADQMAAFEWERAEMIAELERLRAREEQLQKERRGTTPGPGPDTAPEAAQAAAMLSHAQEVADQLLADASHRAQEIIAAAQTRGREAVHRARIRTQDQMQSLYEELDEEFRRLGEATRHSGPDKLPPASPRYDS